MASAKQLAARKKFASMIKGKGKSQSAAASKKVKLPHKMGK